MVLRFDDPSAVSPAELEAAIVEELRHRRMSATFGVIPFVRGKGATSPGEQGLLTLPDDKRKFLAEAVADGTVEVALHGYSHQARGPGIKSEFAGLTLDEQRWRLAQGKSELEAAGLGPVRSFIPPWNAYDQNTLAALEAEGFDAISAGWKGVIPHEARLAFVPATTDLVRVREAVGLARKQADRNPVAVVLFHPYDFAAVDPARGHWSLDAFRTLMDWLASQPDVRVVSVAKALDRVPDLGPGRFRAAAAWRTVQAATPPRFRHKGPVLVYPDRGAYDRALRRVLALYAMLLFAGAAATGAGLAALSITGGARTAAAVTFMVSAAAGGYGVWGLGMSPGALRSAWASRALRQQAMMGEER